LGREVLEKRSWDRGEEVYVGGRVEVAGKVGGYYLEIRDGGFDEIDDGNVGYRVSRGVYGEMYGDLVCQCLNATDRGLTYTPSSQVAHSQHAGDDVFAHVVEDQHLVLSASI
jgi:hypothetical protein